MVEVRIRLIIRRRRIVWLVAAFTISRGRGGFILSIR